MYVQSTDYRSTSVRCDVILIVVIVTITFPRLHHG